MKKSVAIVILIILIAVGSVGVFCATGNIKEVSLDTLAEKVQQEQVESIIVQGDNLEVTLKDGTILYSKKEAENSLISSLLNHGASAKNLGKVMRTENIEIENGKFFGVLPSFSFLYMFIVPIIWFLVCYYLILTGFKILKIKGIPKSKVAVYILVMFLFNLFLNSVILTALKDISDNKLILHFVNLLVSFLIVFLLLKYYFLLSGKKLWQFLLYLIVLSVTFSLVIKLLLI